MSPRKWRWCRWWLFPSSNWFFKKLNEHPMSIQFVVFALKKRDLIPAPKRICRNLPRMKVSRLRAPTSAKKCQKEKEKRETLQQKKWIIWLIWAGRGCDLCQKWRRPHLSTESIHQTRYKTYFGGDDDDSVGQLAGSGPISQWGLGPIRRRQCTDLLQYNTLNFM